MKHTTSVIQLIVAVLATLFISAFIAQITEIPFIYLFAGLMAVGLIKRPEGVLRDEVNPDVTKILTYLGKVKQGVFTKLVNSMDVSNDITLVPNVKNILTLTELKIRNGFKPYTGVFRPASDDLDYDPRTLAVEQMQRDLRIDPRKYRLTYFS